MNEVAIVFTKEQIETLRDICTFYRSITDKSGVDEKVQEIQKILIKETWKFENDLPTVP